jgi:hypothetical protein
VNPSGGDEFDAARALVERAERNELTWEWIELAAFCGHGAAMRAAEPEAVAGLAELDWPERLAILPRADLARATTEAVRAIAPVWGEQVGDSRVRVAVDAATVWAELEDPKAAAVAAGARDLLQAATTRDRAQLGELAAIGDAALALVQAVIEDTTRSPKVRSAEFRRPWEEAFVKAEAARPAAVRSALARWLVK